MSPELTPAQVEEFLRSSMTSYTLQGGRTVQMSEVLAYVQKLHAKVVKLALALSEHL